MRILVEVEQRWSGIVEADSLAEAERMAEEITPEEMGLAFDSQEIYVNPESS